MGTREAPAARYTCAHVVLNTGVSGRDDSSMNQFLAFTMFVGLLYPARRTPSRPSRPGPDLHHQPRGSSTSRYGAVSMVMAFVYWQLTRQSGRHMPTLLPAIALVLLVHRAPALGVVIERIAIARNAGLDAPVGVSLVVTIGLFVLTASASPRQVWNATTGRSHGSEPPFFRDTTTTSPSVTLPSGSRTTTTPDRRSLAVGGRRRRRCTCAAGTAPGSGTGRCVLRSTTRSCCALFGGAAQQPRLDAELGDRLVARRLLLAGILLVSSEVGSGLLPADASWSSTPSRPRCFGAAARRTCRWCLRRLAMLARPRPGATAVGYLPTTARGWTASGVQPMPDDRAVPRRRSSRPRHGCASVRFYKGISVARLCRRETGALQIGSACVIVLRAGHPAGHSGAQTRRASATGDWRSPTQHHHAVARAAHRLRRLRGRWRQLSLHGHRGGRRLRSWRHHLAAGDRGSPS